MKIIVLGAGIIGVTTAWQLLGDGHQVTVVDRAGGPAEFASFANAGLVAPGHAFDKLPGGDGFKEHQDVQAGWDDYASVHITAMVAIDATNEENGSLEVIAGLHKQGVLGSMWAPLTDEDTGAVAYVPVHCQPGDAVFFDSYAPHRSNPNHSGKARRVLYITYNKASEGDSREQYYADKRRSYPPDIERDPGKDYSFRV